MLTYTCTFKISYILAVISRVVCTYVHIYTYIHIYTRTSISIRMYKYTYISARYVRLYTCI